MHPNVPIFMKAAAALNSDLPKAPPGPFTSTPAMNQVLETLRSWEEVIILSHYNDNDQATIIFKTSSSRISARALVHIATIMSGIQRVTFPSVEDGEPVTFSASLGHGDDDEDPGYLLGIYLTRN